MKSRQKRLAVISFLFFAYISTAFISKEKDSHGLTSIETYVYLCNSPGGKKYHYTKTCRGLNRCKAEIIKITLKEAQKRGKTLCGWED